MRSFLPGSPTPSSTLADKLVWVSAFMPQPFRRIQVIHVFWKEEHQPGAWGPAPPHFPGFVPCLAASTVTTVGPDGTTPTASAAAAEPGSPWLEGSSSHEDDIYHASAPATHLSACLLGSSRLQLRTSAALSPASAPVDCPVRLREDDASSCLRSLKLRLAFGSELRHHWPRPKCDFIHPRQLSPFLERLVLPFSNEVILSGYEEFDSSGTDLFTTWVKMSEHEILVQHMVDVEKATSEFREAPERKHATCSHMNSSSKRFATPFD